jgi:hypothetical protein
MWKWYWRIRWQKGVRGRCGGGIDGNYCPKSKRVPFHRGSTSSDSKENNEGDLVFKWRVTWIRSLRHSYGLRVLCGHANRQHGNPKHAAFTKLCHPKIEEDSIVTHWEICRIWRLPLILAHFFVRGEKGLDCVKSWIRIGSSYAPSVDCLVPCGPLSGIQYWRNQNRQEDSSNCKA